MISFQYDPETGDFRGASSGVPSEETLKALGVEQLLLPDGTDIENKKVDLESKTLVDGPAPLAPIVSPAIHIYELLVANGVLKRDSIEPDVLLAINEYLLSLGRPTL